MIRVRTSVEADDVLQHAKHRLFVEGKDSKAFDPRVLRTFFRALVHVDALGPSFHVRSVADALHRTHPYYYFLIDRDHHNDEFVERCWSKFPDPETSNLLVWRRRELENYFLIPEYALKSEWLYVDPDVLLQRIREAFQNRLYLDTANQVIVRTREALKQEWIKAFDQPSDFPNKEAALAQLLTRSEFESQKQKVAARLGKDELISLFERILADLSGGTIPLEYGCGNWLEMLRGKEVLPTIVQTCFRVKDLSENRVQGPAAVEEVAKSLLSRPLVDQPEDFQQLHGLLENRIRPA